VDEAGRGPGAGGPRVVAADRGVGPALQAHRGEPAPVQPALARGRPAALRPQPLRGGCGLPLPCPAEEGPSRVSGSEDRGRSALRHWRHWPARSGAAEPPPERALRPGGEARDAGGQHWPARHPRLLQGRGHRGGHRALGAAPHLRAVLHHQAARARHRAGPGDRLPHRPGPRRPHRRAEPRRRGLHLHRSSSDSPHLFHIHEELMSKRPGKILVVDDDKVVLRAVTEILQREGYTVVAIDDAVEGLAASKDPSVDVAVLDIRMPHLSGMDLLRAIKQARADVEVVMMTAFATVETAVEAVKAGAYDYL